MTRGKGAGSAQRLQAILWLQQLRSAEPRYSLWQYWNRWSIRTGNRDVYDGVVQVWQQLDLVPRPRAVTHVEHALDSYDGSVPVNAWSEPTRSTVPRQVSAQRSMFTPMRIAAAVAMIAVTAAIGVTQLHAMVETIETQPSEWRSRVLEDGTVARLGPRTRIDIDLSDESRRIDLPRGEVMFEVAKDEARPFIVTSPLAHARAVGTQYAVSHYRDKTTVTVKEGIVAVSRRDRGSSHQPLAPDDAMEMRLLAGEQVQVADGVSLLKARVDVDSELAWVHGKVHVKNGSLLDVTEQVNRRNLVQVDMDPNVAVGLRVDGRLAINDPVGFAVSAAQLTDSRLVWVSPTLVRVEQNSKRKAGR